MRTSLIFAATLLLAGCTAPVSDPSGPEPLAGPSPGDEAPSDGAASPPAGAANLTVEVLDVGQGDATVLHAGGDTLLVDAGNWRQASRQAVLDHLADDDVTELEGLVLTHPDADHTGGCADVLERYPVSLVVHPGSSKDTRTWARCEEGIGAEGARVLTDRDLDPSDRLDVLGAVGVQLLWIDAQASDVNDGSIVLRVSTGSTDALLTGDASCEVEETILSLGLPVEAELLKVGHHGSRSSTCDRWLDAVDPTHATISAGADNPYGHPHQAVLDRLAAHDAHTATTAEQGTIVYTTNGTAWTTSANETADEPDEPAGDPPPVRVAEVHADAPGDDHDNPNGEWVELASDANTTVALDGWRLADEGGHTYAFPAGTEVAPNATLRVYTGSGEDDGTALFWGRASAVWNNAGDTARLYDGHDRLVDELSYG